MLLRFKAVEKNTTGLTPHSQIYYRDREEHNGERETEIEIKRESDRERERKKDGWKKGAGDSKRNGQAGHFLPHWSAVGLSAGTN